MMHTGIDIIYTKTNKKFTSGKNLSSIDLKSYRQLSIPRRSDWRIVEDINIS